MKSEFEAAVIVRSPDGTERELNSKDLRNQAKKVLQNDQIGQRVTFAEYPILYTGAMVLAMLREENPKWQTRRIPKTLERINADIENWELVELVDDPKLVQKATAQFQHVQSGEIQFVSCPWGRAGDSIWGRETLKKVDEVWTYAADGKDVEVEWEHEGAMLTWAHHKEQNWCPSIHAPKWSSRIRKPLVKVRLERVGLISWDDAIAEGLTGLTKDGGQTVKWGIPDRDGWPGRDDLGWDWSRWCVSPIVAYSQLWDDINGKKWPFDRSPWCWVLESLR